MMTAKEYEALKDSIPETRPEGERGAAMSGSGNEAARAELREKLCS